MTDTPPPRPMKISVVIPVYNCEKFLCAAVSSVLEQPYQSIDVVLVNDGSTDRSGLLCDALAKDNCKITALHQKNGGVSAARNAGIAHILAHHWDGRSEHYLAFLDADDAWTKNFFTDQSVAGFAAADMLRFQSVGCNAKLTRCLAPTAVKEGRYPGSDAAVRLCLTSSFAAALYYSAFLTRSKIRFSVGLSASEDMLFLRSCAHAANDISIYSRVLYLYRNNPASFVHARDVHGFAYYEPMMRAYLENDYDGGGFVAWYFVDAVEDHFKNGGSVAAAKAWIASHADYAGIAENRGGARAAAVFSALENTPRRYAVKLHRKGIAFRAARRVAHTPPFSNLLDILRYRYAIPKY